MDNDTPTKERPQYEILIDKFMEIDALCSQAIEKLQNGSILIDCLPPQGAKTLEELMAEMKLRYVAFQEQIRDALESRNAILQEAQSALRAAVIASEDTVRGPDGKTTVVKYGPFEVTSKTSRGFNPEVLLPRIQEQGLYQRYLDQQVPDQKTGALVPIAKQEWTLLYEPTKNFLRELNQEQLLQAAYEEEESTPAVTGPKPLALLTQIEAKKGKKK